MSKLYPIIYLSLIFLFVNCDHKEISKSSKENILKAKQIPLEDFFKNPENPVIKYPNGDYYSFMAPYKNRMNIFIQKGETLLQFS